MSVTAKNYLESEIAEQKVLIQELLEDKARVEGIGVQGLNLGKVSHIQIIACGSSYNAGLLGLKYLESTSNIPVSIVHGSEFVFSESPSKAKTLYIVISQSGETKDILDSVDILVKEKCQIIGISNEKNSTLSKKISISHFLNCGKEKSVAATKTFTMTCIYLYIFSLALGKNRGLIKAKKFEEGINSISNFSNQLEHIFSNADKTSRIASNISKYRSIMYLGNGSDYPVALESSLKLREVSLLHVEGIPAGELKHGPIAMLDNQVCVIALVTKNEYFERQSELLKSIVLSGANLTILTTLENINVNGAEVVKVKGSTQNFSPLILNVLGQLLALNVGTILNRNIDKPRNLTKVMSI